MPIKQKPVVKAKPIVKPAKKTPVKASTKPVAKELPEIKYHMPKPVSDWIESASSRIKHLTGEVSRLKDEIKELKSYRLWAEHRILRSEKEEIR